MSLICRAATIYKLLWRRHRTDGEVFRRGHVLVAARSGSPSSSAPASGNATPTQGVVPLLFGPYDHSPFDLIEFFFRTTGVADPSQLRRHP